MYSLSKQNEKGHLIGLEWNVVLGQVAASGRNEWRPADARETEIRAAVVICQAFKSDADKEEAVQEVTKKTAAVTVKEKPAAVAVAEHVEVCVPLRQFYDRSNNSVQTQHQQCSRQEQVAGFNTGAGAYVPICTLSTQIILCRDN